MTKSHWLVMVPGYPPFHMVGEKMNEAQALAAVRSIWPAAEVS